MSFVIKKRCGVNIAVSDKESPAVRIAAKNLRTDLEKVASVSDGVDAKIYIGTLGVSEDISEYADTEVFRDENGNIRKEAYLISVKDNVLSLCGSDRRGTIYAVYEFCEQIGVSPWYFFADVPVKTKEEISLPNGYLKTDYPTVEYRGIFINDEEELERWVTLNMGEETIGVKTYEKIFELILRLKGNYIWPAMHVNSFNIKRENGALADKMGIVVGTSHCDMLMRSNNREWYPWIEKKGYTDAEYDYSMPGRNREILKEYWRESIEQNKDFEVSYTLGMRGVHDSGFEVKGLGGYKGEELTKKKIELLEMIIRDQNEMLNEIVGRKTQKNFVPYKEVLNLYDAGLKVPEDFTLIWSNDNYGYIRRYPSAEEQNRSGGNGIYYHNSYWSPPNASYLFICSIPLSHTKHELKKAFENGIQKLWVMNVGALKPIEAETEFFLRYAWEITKEDTTADVDRYMENWINKNFSADIGKECAELFNAFDALANVRKVEFLENGVFSFDCGGDEWTDRINCFRELYTRANELYYTLPENERAAFYELVLMKIHAGYYMNAQYYYADRSRRANKLGMGAAAKKYTELSLEFDNKKRRLIEYYNHILLGGKWNGILMPETFPPPVASMHPACMPPLTLDNSSELIAAVYNGGDSLCFADKSTKWIDIGVTGSKVLEYSISVPEWLDASSLGGTLKDEERILFTPNKTADNEGEIKITAREKTITVPVSVSMVDGKNITDDGMICVEATDGKSVGFEVIEHLGRGEGDLLEARDEGGYAEYEITVSKPGEAELEIHRFPSLNSVGRIRIGVSIDGGEVQIAESLSNDEHKGTWLDNILNGVDRLSLNLGHISEGRHTVKFTAIDKYFAFSRFVLSFNGQKNNMGMHFKDNNQALPQIPEDEFYKGINLMPRPQQYSSLNPPENTLLKTVTEIFDPEYAKKRQISDIVAEGNAVFTEMDGHIKINAAAALANSEFACASADITYCNSESCGQSSVAVYGGEVKQYDTASAPKISYKVNASGGEYRLWILTKEPRMGRPHIDVRVNGTTVEEYNNRGNLWRYETEQVWHWNPYCEVKLENGENDIEFLFVTGGIRLDRIYITNGGELPPSDLNW